MNIQTLLQQLQRAPEQIQFAQVMATIDNYYHYEEAGFSNGIGDDKLHNAADSNEGSCKIFAFAKVNNLNPAQTLACFGDFYRLDVLQHPDGSDHGNIRRFMRDGWAGIEFEKMPLHPI